MLLFLFVFGHEIWEIGDGSGGGEFDFEGAAQQMAVH